MDTRTNYPCYPYPRQNNYQDTLILTSTRNFKCYLEQSVHKKPLIQNQSMDKPSSPIEIPQDLYLTLFSYLEFRELINASMASKSFKILSEKHTFLWKSMFSKMTGIDETLLPDEEFEGMYKSSIKVYFVSISILNKDEAPYLRAVFDDLYGTALYEKNFFIFSSLTTELSHFSTSGEKLVFFGLKIPKIFFSKCISKILSQPKEKQKKDIFTLKEIFTNLNNLITSKKLYQTLPLDFLSQVTGLIPYAIEKKDIPLIDWIIENNDLIFNTELPVAELAAIFAQLIFSSIINNEYDRVHFILERVTNQIPLRKCLPYHLLLIYYENKTKLFKLDTIKKIFQVMTTLEPSLALREEFAFINKYVDTPMLTSVHKFKCYVEQSIQKNTLVQNSCTDEPSSEPSSPIEIPQDLYLTLFSYLEFRELINASMASKSFKILSEKHTFLWKSMFSKMTGIDETLLPDEEYEGMYKSSIKVYFVSISELLIKNKKSYLKKMNGKLFLEALREKNLFIFASLTTELSHEFFSGEKSVSTSLPTIEVTKSFSECMSQILSQSKESQKKDISTLKEVFINLNKVFTSENEKNSIDFILQIARLIPYAIETKNIQLIDFIIENNDLIFDVEQRELPKSSESSNVFEMDLYELHKISSFAALSVSFAELIINFILVKKDNEVDFILNRIPHNVWLRKCLCLRLSFACDENKTKLDEIDTIKKIIQVMATLFPSTDITNISRTLWFICFSNAVYQLNFEKAEILFDRIKLSKSNLEKVLKDFPKDKPGFPEAKEYLEMKMELYSTCTIF